MTAQAPDIDELPPLATRPTYNHVQVVEFYQHIGIVEALRFADVASQSDELQLKHLTLVLRRTLATLPFENLSLHYSVHKHMTISPQLLFEKIVHGRCDDGTIISGNRRGGYCMQNNLLFGTFLRSIGYNVTSVAARVKMGESFSGWGHMVNIVCIAHKRYHLDVGFGPNGPTRPMLLEHNFTSPHIAPAQQRIRYTRLHEHTNPDSRIWVYEHRITDDQPWQIMYCIGADTEFLPQDYAVMNYSTSHRRDIFFTYEVICTRFTISPGSSDELNGCLILDTGLKRRAWGRNKKIVEKFATDAERLQALHEYFDIQMPDEDAMAIRSMPSQIKA